MDSNREGTARSLDSELVDVFDTNSDSEGLVVKGLLESAGIESVLISIDAPQEVLPGVGGVVVRVPADKADEARQVIEEYRSGASDETTDETTDDSAA
jgi:hypothetical protein